VDHGQPQLRATTLAYPEESAAPVHERLADGSYLSQIESAPATRNKLPPQDAPPLTVRVID
jgi:hypothetical protein